MKKKPVGGMSRPSKITMKMYEKSPMDKEKKGASEGSKKEISTDKRVVKSINKKKP